MDAAALTVLHRHVNAQRVLDLLLRKGAGGWI
jgi:hypothetical protein